MPATRQARSRCSHWKFIAYLHWAVSWWVDGKPAVYYYLGTDDTKHRQLESFTVSLIPPVRGPVKRVFHKPHWEIFAMVSIQIWVTRFHVSCTGELEQGCLAALTGSPFFSTALESHAKFTAYDKRCFFSPSSLWWMGAALVPAAKVIQVSATVPRGCRTQGDPVQYRHEESQEASREPVTLRASHDGWKQVRWEHVCFGCSGCNHRWFPEGHGSSGTAYYCPTGRN